MESELKDRIKRAHEALEVLKEPLVLEQARGEAADRLRQTLAEHVITSYSIHYTKLYEPVSPCCGMLRPNGTERNASRVNRMHL